MSPTKIIKCTWPTLQAEPRMLQNRVPGASWLYFAGWPQNAKSMFLAIILLTSGARARKSPNRHSGLWFCRLLEPGPESLQIDTPGSDFVDFWSQGQKVFKSMLQVMILSTSGARARKSSNRYSRLWFCRLLEPGPESLQNDTPGYDFVDFSLRICA